MAILKTLRRWLAAAALALLPWQGALAAGELIVLCYHEVESDRALKLTPTALRASDLAAQFAWLRAAGYTPVSLQRVLEARRGGAPLPDKAVLLTFDDGKKDVYTRAFPLLKLFGYPAVVALVGRWLEVPAGGTVDYDGVPLPRADFVSWDDVREMQRSGLVEIASHSFDLHRGVPANPQGNTEPAAISRIYADGRYENDAAYLERLRADLAASRALLEKQTGRAPRAVAWPYGRSNRAAQAVASALGFEVGFTLEDGLNTVATPPAEMKRYLIDGTAPLQSFAESMRRVWQPDPARSVRVVPATWPPGVDSLSPTLDRILRLQTNVAFVDPRAGGEGGAVLFPTTRRPLARDELNHIAWQIERRAGSPVFIELPADWLDDAELLGDLAKHVNFAGIRVPVAPGDPRMAAVRAAIERWCWPLRVAYAPAVPPAPAAWDALSVGDLVVLRAALAGAVERRYAGRVLFEYAAEPGTAATVATGMRRLEAEGFRQFGLAALPVEGFDAAWTALSLRSQPQLP